MYSCGPLHIDYQRQDDQLEPTYSSSMPIRDVAPKTCRKQWTIGSSGERGSGIFALMAWHDDDDDDDVYRKPTFIGLYISWDSFAPKSRKINFVKCLTYGALMICSTSRIDAEIKKVTEIFLKNGSPDNIIKSIDAIRSFDPSKYPVYVKLPWIGLVSQLFADNISRLCTVLTLLRWEISLPRDPPFCLPLKHLIFTVIKYDGFWISMSVWCRLYRKEYSKTGSSN